MKHYFPIWLEGGCETTMTQECVKSVVLFRKPQSKQVLLLLVS